MWVGEKRSQWGKFEYIWLLKKNLIAKQGIEHALRTTWQAITLLFSRALASLTIINEINKYCIYSWSQSRARHVLSQFGALTVVQGSGGQLADGRLASGRRSFEHRIVRLVRVQSAEGVETGQRSERSQRVRREILQLTIFVLFPDLFS